MHKQTLEQTQEEERMYTHSQLRMQALLHKQELLLFDATINIENLIQTTHDYVRTYKKNVEEFATLDQHNTILALKINALQLQPNLDLLAILNLLEIHKNLIKEGDKLLQYILPLGIMRGALDESKKIISEMQSQTSPDIAISVVAVTATLATQHNLLSLHKSFSKKASKLIKNWDNLIQKIGITSSKK